MEGRLCLDFYINMKIRLRQNKNVDKRGGKDSHFINYRHGKCPLVAKFIIV